ncbi:hypothetical protein OUY22_35575 [Nonomuraea sp. MCN248]|uniref:Uncharacterized protein n=1 Tax=Nonomuraea corallina TaxID=2989783 RepID=A0ABT4SP13_9ACTN|nr:hypothetical protein [Nonomuraea corallina]MDA0638760.1 hypothetical protein [Nonomuraea corallina]
MTGERGKEWAHPWFAIVVGPRPSEEVPEEDERRKRRRPPRVKVRRTT